MVTKAPPKNMGPILDYEEDNSSLFLQKLDTIINQLNQLLVIFGNDEDIQIENIMVTDTTKDLALPSVKVPTGRVVTIRSRTGNPPLSRFSISTKVDSQKTVVLPPGGWVTWQIKNINNLRVTGDTVNAILEIYVEKR